jgi:uncharacterized protein DUF2750
MSISGAHAAAFFVEVPREGQGWSIRDSEGFPAPLAADGVRAMPFWSLPSRAEKFISTVEAYAAFQKAIPLSEWRSKWLPATLCQHRNQVAGQEQQRKNARKNGLDFRGLLPIPGAHTQFLVAASKPKSRAIHLDGVTSRPGFPCAR